VEFALEAARQGCLHCRGEEVSGSKIKVNNPTLATTARMGTLRSVDETGG